MYNGVDIIRTTMFTLSIIVREKCEKEEKTNVENGKHKYASKV